MQHCVASLRKENILEAFACYMGEGMRILTENTANMAGGSSLSSRFYDILHPEKKEKPKTAEQVIDHLRQKMS